ncbi:MAG: hypothetical protein COX30_00265 [Candidatus Moranbacteria bacterium CG23_combo_of_CG06-09_8_20_14_all_39_10]|nr:MAG: hypothetical protein COX30_00265 [Candidatus Moranbacteria bacterium CG23_combo_of_CG06-09_8_20_14_all_39_10]
MIENNKTKIALSSVAIVIMIATAFYYFKTLESKKVEIKNSENVAQTKDNASDNPVESEQAVQPEIVQDTPKVEEKKQPMAQDTADKSTETSKKSASGDNSVKIVDKLVNFGFQQAKNRSIDTIIIHSSYDAIGKDPFSISGIIKEYEEYGVSAHYLIGRDGVIYRLVADKDIAYHAGAGKVPDGRTGINAFSLGIEMVNTKTDDFTNKQYEALNGLISKLKKEYKIKYVLGHNQIAPNRKDDPWNFDWNKLK